MDATEVLVRLWTAGDGVTHTVAITLLAMSVAAWYLILAKAWDWWRLRRSADAVEAFWNASTVPEGLARLGSSPFRDLAAQAGRCADHWEEAGALGSRFDPSEQLERTLRQQYARAQSEVENGLTWLATTGATAPFVGLFGTVWGIYHALVAIGFTGQASLEKVAGPVGEALVMTAAGLAVALPAVFAYNTFARANRVLLADLDAFAHDLHAFFTVGRPLTTHGSRIHPQRARTATGAA